MRRIVALFAWGILAIAANAQYQPNMNSQPPQASPSVPERVRTFQPQLLKLFWNNRRWQIVDGSTVLKDFGSREREARQALRIIQELGVNQYGSIGTPNPVMEYWLINGRAPTWLPRESIRIQPLDPSRIRVDQVQGQWCVRDSVRVLFSFGEQAEEAQQALAIIKKYDFTQVGSVGIGAPLMYVFFGRPDSILPGLPLTQTGSASPSPLDTPRFSRIAKNPDGTPHVQNTVPVAGMQAAAPAVLPPLANVGATNASPGGMSNQSPQMGQPSPAWREQPHFGPRQTTQASESADRVSFDWRQVQLQVDRTGDWKLTAGSMVLGSFGTNIQAARTALFAVRYYRLSEQWRPGGDASGLRYYLANAQAPRGVMIGLNGRSFDPLKMAVRPYDGGFVVTDGSVVLLPFGSHQREAEKLVEAIKHDHYDQLCQLGELGKDTMTILVRSR